MRQGARKDTHTIETWGQNTTIENNNQDRTQKTSNKLNHNHATISFEYQTQLNLLSQPPKQPAPIQHTTYELFTVRHPTK